MSEQANAENTSDVALLALRDLAAAVAGLDDWGPIRDWALKGGGEFHLPPQLSELESYRAAGSALAADERLAALINEDLPDRPIVRVGLFGLQLRASVLPAGMLASAVAQCCLREPYTDRPAPVALGDVLAENLNALRRIAARKTVTLPCLAGVRGVRLGPGQASLTTVLGTLHSKDAFHVPELAVRSGPDVLVTTTVRTQVQLLRENDKKWGAEDPAMEAAAQRLSHLRLALLLGPALEEQVDLRDWARTTVTGFSFLLPFAVTPGWRVLTVAGDPAGRDFSDAEQASWAEAARHLSALNLTSIQLAIDRFLLAATERTTAADALVDAVVSLDALFGAPGEARLRVGAAVAWLLEGNSAEGRMRLFKEVFDIYGARSIVVHGNRSSRRSAEEMVEDALQLALRVLATILYPAKWLLDTPKSADRALALILGAHDYGQPLGDPPPAA
jgi:Apea-like HEPN